MTEFRREVRFESGYDHREGAPTRDPDKGNVGCSGLSIRFLLHGPAATVQFVMYTDWLPSDVVDGGWGRRVDRKREWATGTRYSGHGCADLYPMATDLGYHADAAQYDDQDTLACDVREGDCFYDGSGLRAESVMAALFEEGDRAVWAALETEYAERFEPDASEPENTGTS